MDSCLHLNKAHAPSKATLHVAAAKAGSHHSCFQASCLVQVKKVEVQRFYRPEDISRQQAYGAGLWEVYASTERETIDLASVVGGCIVAASAPAERRPGKHLSSCSARVLRMPVSMASQVARLACRPWQAAGQQLRFAT